MQRGLFVHTSNRLEELLEALAAVMTGEPLPPLQDEVVVVPSQGLARWLKQGLAEQHGIAAGLRLPFPGAFLQQLASGEPEGVAALFAPDVLLFRLWRLLDDAKLAATFGPAAAYIADDPDDRKRFQLCGRIASVFDDYQLYRPTLLPRWAAGDDTPELGPHAAWQAHLWRALLRDAGLAAAPARPTVVRRRPTPGPGLFGDPPPPPTTDLAHRVGLLQRRLADAAAAAAMLPTRLCVFGTGTLPPAFVQLLAAAAAHVPVHLFVPQPTNHYAGDQRTRRGAVAAGDNALLARFGRQALDFADELLDAETRATTGSWHRLDLTALAGREAGTEPHSLLDCLQRDVATVADRGSVRGPARFRLRADDDSLRVHDCHSPQRELEVVRDQILAAFARDPSLAPHDVLVLVPDIERYAPFAHAVFGPVSDHLPFRVADKSPASELPLCASVFALLELARGRLQAHDVLHLLDEPSLQRRFRIFGGDLPYLRARCEAAGIRWGLDGTARERTCRVPAFDDNSWLHGLERLLLGVATGPCDDLVFGALPVADTTGSREQLLVRFLHFTRTLFAQLDGVMRPQPLAAWADRVDALVATMHEPATADEDAAVEQLRTATARLRRLAETTNFAGPLHAVVLQDWLRQALQQSTDSRGFLAGAVTVAAMRPMRAVPVRCLFVCGLDDVSFPRRDHALAFDLIAAHPARGDRSVRADDQQMFLDALLSARELLHVTFVGRSQKDDSECAPSTVLAELLDQVDRACVAPEAFPSARDAVLVRHALQPWDPRYRRGDDARLFTFTRADLEVTGDPADEAPWFRAAQSPRPTAPATELSLDALVEFWWHPCRYFLRHVVRLRLPRDDDRDDTMEPFRVGPLERWQLQTGLVARALRGVPRPADPALHMRATGMLPIGGLGQAAFLDVDDEVQRFLGQLREHGTLSAQPLAVTIGDTTVRGEVPGVGGDALVYARIAKRKPKDHLRAWLFHVFAACARAAGEPWPAHTRVVMKSKPARLQPLPAVLAREHAALLVEGFRRGTVEPLPFFEWSSHEYGKKLHEGKSDTAALRAARGKWEPASPDNYEAGDCEDADIRLCWRGREPLAEHSFDELARAVWRTAYGFTTEVE